MKKIAKKNLKLDKEVIASLSENEMVGVTGGGIPPETKDNPRCPAPMTDKPNCTETINKECQLPMHTEEFFCVDVLTNGKFSCDCEFLTTRNGNSPVTFRPCETLTTNCFVGG